MPNATFAQSLVSHPTPLSPLTGHVELGVPVQHHDVSELLRSAKLAEDSHPALSNPQLFCQAHLPSTLKSLDLVMCTTTKDMSFSELCTSLESDGLRCAGLRHGILVAKHLPQIQMDGSKILLPGAVSLAKIDDQLKYPFLGRWGIRRIMGLRATTDVVEKGTRVIGVCTLPAKA